MKIPESIIKVYFLGFILMVFFTTLTVFERKILRKIYGPVTENELWRTRQNDELEAVIKGEKIVRFIKCQ